MIGPQDLDGACRLLGYSREAVDIAIENDPEEVCERLMAASLYWGVDSPRCHAFMILHKHAEGIIRGAPDSSAHRRLVAREAGK